MTTPRAATRILGRLLVALLLAAAARPAGAAITASLVADGLEAPLFATAPDLDHRLFIVERAGRIRILQDGSVLPTPFLDISAKVRTDGERGLLGLAFAPDYPTSGVFYVYYIDLAGNSQISRFHRGAGADIADTIEEPILTLGQPQANHNGGTIAFGPDGLLYFAPGDGGGSNDPAERSQDGGELLGKMLRLDVGPVFAPGSTPVNGTGYAVPAGNPFAGLPGFRPEIWAFGLRNPYRFSFDRATGDLWIADVGQGQREEIDFEPLGDPGGRNYGWDVMEGNRCNTADPAPAPPCNDPSLTLPVYEYDHGAGNCSITGGFVSRGDLPEWAGHYVFGDFCSGRIWTLDPATLLATERTAQLGAAGGRSFELVGFGRDALGRLYVVLSGGEIHRIEPVGACNDGVDNDGDGGIDFGGDPGCGSSLARSEAPACNDGVDNDGDGDVDLADGNCRGDPSGTSERPPGPFCGLGPEIVILLGGLAVARRCRGRARDASVGS